MLEWQAINKIEAASTGHMVTLKAFAEPNLDENDDTKVSLRGKDSVCGLQFFVVSHDFGRSS